MKTKQLCGLSMSIRRMMAAAAMTLAAIAANAATWYVGDDSQWTTKPSQSVKTSLNEAYSAAAAGDSIWVAGGTYSVSAITLRNGVSIYGSFAGTEDDIAQRVRTAGGKAWDFANPTILTGSGIILASAANSTAATIDGLIFDGENVSGNKKAISFTAGGTSSNIIVQNCIIRNYISTASDWFILKNKTEMRYCKITNNTNSTGNFMYLDYGSSLRSSEVVGNTTSGNMVSANCITGGTCEVSGSIVANNTAGGTGGIYLNQGNAYNNLVANNTTSGTVAGIAFDIRKISRAYNNTIVNNQTTNTSDDATGGVGFYNNTNAAKAASVLYNSILIGNKKGDVIHNLAKQNHSAATNNSSTLAANVYNCIVDRQDYNNITFNASITQTDASAVFTDAASGDYSLIAGSPAIDAGTSSGITLPATDYAGNARSSGGAVDIGAWEWTPSTEVTLSNLTIDGAVISGFNPTTTQYEVRIPPPAGAYPVIAPTPSNPMAEVSPITYTPAVFDRTIINTAVFSVSSGGQSLEYRINFREDSMLYLSNLIIQRVRSLHLTRDAASLDADVAAYLALMQENGQFTDCAYVSVQQGDDLPLNHLYRLREMGIAYTSPQSSYYQSDDLYTKIVRGYEYWYSRNWRDGSWWHREVGHPTNLGLALIAMWGGLRDIRQEAVFANIVARWSSDDMGGRDITYSSVGSAARAGANRVYVANHWVFLAALTNDEQRLATASTHAFIILEQTTGEGVQHDWSFRQHGSQLYIVGYGTEYVRLCLDDAYYLAGTKYAAATDRISVISEFVRNTYLKTIRGQGVSFSVMGRGITRTNNLNHSHFAASLNLLLTADPAYTDEYNAAIKRLKAEESPSYGVSPSQTHYYRGEYTLQQRPEYTFDVRMASNRMGRSEYYKNENRQGFFVSDGSTNILVDGEEYRSIIPFWDWKKIPGTTIPDLAIMRRADNYVFNGRSSYAGGVTDGIYGVTAFDMKNDQELYAYNDDHGINGSPAADGPRLPALDFGAKKSWFIFDSEIVCLGAGIYSGHDEPIFTTLNQCRRVGTPVISSNGTEQNLGEGTAQQYSNVDWALNDKVAYYFPYRSNVWAASETKNGSWYDVNEDGSQDEISGDLFTLWLDHGARTSNANYAYIIVPNVNSAQQARAYNTADIEILVNSDSLQAVYNRRLNMYGFAFFRSGTYIGTNLAIDAGAGCVVLVKNADQAEFNVWVSDPQKQSLPIQLGIKTSALGEMKAVTYVNPASPHTGKSLEFIVNNESPAYEGKDILLGRTGWVVTSSYSGCADGSVGGNNPQNIVDNNASSVFSMVKPSKNYACTCGSVPDAAPYQCADFPSLNNPPADAVPYFVIDMQSVQQFNAIVYRHRTDNTTNGLRLRGASLYGRNSEDEEFVPIAEDFEIPTDAAEVRVEFAQVSYRYVKFVYKTWDPVNSSSIQVSEFNVGSRVMPEIPEYVYVQSVSLPAALSLTIGAVHTLTAVILPANATNQNLTWSSSNTSVATVNIGVVTAVAAGTATITVTADGNKTAQCVVTVTANGGGNDGSGGSGGSGGNDGNDQTAVVAESLPKLAVYPNPAGSMLYITDEYEGLVEIYDLSGALLLTSTSNSINISALPSGIYIVKAGGKAAKVVKQ